MASGRAGQAGSHEAAIGEVPRSAKKRRTAFRRGSRSQCAGSVRGSISTWTWTVSSGERFCTTEPTGSG